MNIPFLGHADGSQTLAYRSSERVSAAEFLSDVQTLAQGLPSCAYAVNLCRDRYCFAVALAAAMLRGQISLLPQSHTPESLRVIRRDYADQCLIIDSDESGETGSIPVTTGTGCAPYRLDHLAFESEATAVIAFTSGSTGTPVPNRKTWGALARGATGEASRFGLDENVATTIVGTVPPQHMYGFESTVLMPMRGGLIMHAAKPFFPADIRAVLAEVDTNRVLVSTPVHLRALLVSDVELPPLRLVVCATAPLSTMIARQFEHRFDVQVHEVYGFTEAGMVATRRPTQGPQWRLLPDVGMRVAEDQVFVSGGHVPAEVPFDDNIAVVDESNFLLHGRSSDVINVAGKRSSIAYLDHQLCEIDGVIDGAFFVPNENSETVSRPVAFVVAPGLTPVQLVQALAQRVDRVFLPRPLYLVDALPRNSTGKLTRQALLGLNVECASRNNTDPIMVHLAIDSMHPALPGHFPGDPVVPGVVLLDEVINAIVDELPFSEQCAWTIRSAKFHRPVRPGEQMAIRLVPEGDRVVRFACSVDSEMAASGVLEQSRNQAE